MTRSTLAVSVSPIGAVPSSGEGLGVGLAEGGCEGVSVAGALEGAVDGVADGSFQGTAEPERAGSGSPAAAPIEPIATMATITPSAIFFFDMSS
jgi:hypothetical protein